MRRGGTGIAGRWSAVGLLAREWLGAGRPVGPAGGCVCRGVLVVCAPLLDGVMWQQLGVQRLRPVDSLLLLLPVRLGVVTLFQRLVLLRVHCLLLLWHNVRLVALWHVA